MVSSKQIGTLAVHPGTPRRIIAVSSRESDVHEPIVRLLTRRRLLFCHVPNGGFRRASETFALKRAGVKAGVLDLLVFDVPPLRPDVRGVAFEVKRRVGGKVSAEQRAWIADLTARGWLCFVVRSVEEVETALDALGLV